jgi:hypothetical protein
MVKGTADDVLSDLRK